MIHCGLLMATIAYFVRNYTRFFSLSSDVSQLLSTVGNVSTSTMAILGTKLVWFYQKDILRFIKNSSVQSIAIRKTNIIVVVITLWMYSIQMLFSFWLDSTLYSTIHNTFNLVFGLNTDKYGLFFITINMLNTIMELIVMQGCAAYILPRLLIIFIALQLRALGVQFEAFLSKGNSEFYTVKNVMDEYNLLRKTVECLNSWAGGILLCIYISILSFLANLPEILRDGSEAKLGKLYPIIFSSMLGFFLVIASDMPNRVRNSCRTWINKKISQGELSQDEQFLMTVLSQEIKCGEPIGLGCQFFTLTYNFFGSV